MMVGYRATERGNEKRVVLAGVYTSSSASSLFTVFDHQSLSCPKSLYYSENDLISSLNTVFMFPYVSYITSAIYVHGTSFALSLTLNSNYFLSTRPFVIVKIVSLLPLLFLLHFRASLR